MSCSYQKSTLGWKVGVWLAVMRASDIFSMAGSCNMVGCRPSLPFATTRDHARALGDLRGEGPAIPVRGIARLGLSAGDPGKFTVYGLVQP